MADPNNTQIAPPPSPEMPQADVPRTFKERVGGFISGLQGSTSGMGGGGSSNTPLDKELEKAHQARLYQAQLSWKNYSQYMAMSHLKLGSPNPESGEPITQQDLDRWHAWSQDALGQYQKAAGVNKDAKQKIAAGVQRVEALVGLKKKAEAKQAAAGGSPNVPPPSGAGVGGSIAPPPNPNGVLDLNGASTQPIAPDGTATSSGGFPITDAAGAKYSKSPNAIAPPPAAPKADSGYSTEGIAMAPQSAQGMAEQHAIDFSARRSAALLKEATDQRIQVAKTAGLEEGTPEYKEFVATGKFPTAGRYRLQALPGQKLVLGKDALSSYPDLQTVSGEAVDPDKRYDVFRTPDGEYVAALSGPMPASQSGDNTPWKFFLKTKTDEGVPPEQIVKEWNTRYASTSGIKIERDQNGNIVAVPFTQTSTTQQHGGGGGASKGGGTTVSPPPAAPSTGAPKSRGGASVGQAQPITGPDGKQLHAPLSQTAKNNLYYIDSTLSLADRVRPTLEEVNKDLGRGGNLWDSAQQRSAWEQYTKLGLDPANVDPSSIASLLPGVDPRLAKLMPSIAMLQIVGVQPYMHSMRRYDFAQKIMNHLPDPEKDTPQNMLNKLQQLDRNLPGLKAALYRSEGITPSLKDNPELIQSYIRLAGGDRAKAKQMAKQDGWDDTK